MRLTYWERACLHAMKDIVPKFLREHLSYEGWRDRVLYEASNFYGMREEVFQEAYDIWLKGG